MHFDSDTEILSSRNGKADGKKKKKAKKNPILFFLRKLCDMLQSRPLQ